MNLRPILCAMAFIAFAFPGYAKSVAGAEAARISHLIGLCLEAVQDQTSAGFDGWTREDSFVPVGYLSYEQWASAEEDYLLIFAQRGDRKGRPFVCEALREVPADHALSGDQKDRNIVSWVNNLPAATFLGIQFERHDGFARDLNADRLSGCISGQRLLLRATLTSKGAVRFGLQTPRGEFLEC